jgi:hypothetical protein
VCTEKRKTLHNGRTLFEALLDLPNREDGITVLELALEEHISSYMNGDFSGHI